MNNVRRRTPPLRGHTVTPVTQITTSGEQAALLNHLLPPTFLLVEGNDTSHWTAPVRDIDGFSRGHTANESAGMLLELANADARLRVS